MWCLWKLEDHCCPLLQNPSLGIPTIIRCLSPHCMVGMSVRSVPGFLFAETYIVQSHRFCGPCYRFLGGQSGCLVEFPSRSRDGHAWWCRTMVLQSPIYHCFKTRPQNLLSRAPAWPLDILSALSWFWNGPLYFP